MIHLALLLAAQTAPSTQPTAVVSLAVCASPGCLTKPAIDLDCSVAERNQPWRNVQLVRTGGRAYEMTRSDGGRAFERTPIVWAFRGPESPFSSYRQTELNEAEVWFRDGEGTSLIFTDRFSRLQDFSSIRIDTFNRTDDGKTARTFVGFCKTTERPQSPLSDAESRLEQKK